VIEITGLTKDGGPLTKRISLSDDGKLHSDGSACVMSVGRGRRLRFDGLPEFAVHIGRMASDEAIALGALRPDLPDAVTLATKDQLARLNGAAAPDMIARTADHIAYQPGQPALALIDFDTKGMPGRVAGRTNDAGDVWRALVSVVPELATAGRVLRRSTSSGISRADTGEKLAGSNGLHVYVLVADGGDVERFLRTLHDRCWLQGLGWMMVGAGGQLLERSIVDRMVYAAERLVFEGAPILDPPLEQDHESRAAVVRNGVPLDTLAACPPLRIVEKSRLDEMRAAEAHRLAPDRARARETFITDQAARIVAKSGVSPDVARRTIERQCEGVLTSAVVLPFDSRDLEGCTVGDILADPDRFVGATLADPLEGIDYGRCKAKVMRRADGTCWINSFAHGRTAYELKHAADAVVSALAEVPDAEAVSAFVRLALAGDLAETELEPLRDEVCRRTGVGKRVLSQRLKTAQAEQTSKQRAETRERQDALRRDPRPRVDAPPPDAPWLPQMEVLNDVLGASTAPEPPMRDMGGCVTVVRLRCAPSMHALTAHGANDADTSESRLPAPEHPLLTRLDEIQLAEMIERHVDYIDPASGRSVHLGAPFVRHFLTRTDGALPTVSAVATLPMVLRDGTILSGRGLDRGRGIVFRVPDELQLLIPDAKACGPTAVAEAMRFLTDDFLCDVTTDYAGKCVLIAMAATILERLLLPERPAFFISAGQRGSGKTTCANMLSVAALGSRAAAAAWSPNEEERRKSLLAYLTEGVPLICWDNTPRGASIGCPSIEKALTTEFYTDRVLGASEFRSVPATAVHVFTGNNIGPRGDMASRALAAHLLVDRSDPENRPFKHPDPIGWTEANRGRILRALYTVLLGNPRLREKKPAPAETRFKEWWHLVGSAVEYAARQHDEHVAALAMGAPETCPPAPMSFRTLLLEGEADEEQTSSLGTVLEALHGKWSGQFKAAEVATYAGAADESAIEFKAALEQASGKAIKIVTPTVLTWRLKAIVDAPVMMNGKTLTLRYMADKSGNGGTFSVVGDGR
jgi:hypothetical protein